MWLESHLVVEELKKDKQEQESRLTTNRLETRSLKVTKAAEACGWMEASNLIPVRTAINYGNSCVLMREKTENERAADR